MALIDLFVYLGVVAAGISGALVGIKKELDLFGVVSLCVTTSLGGGVIRDVLIGRVPPAAFLDATPFFVSLAAGLVTWTFYRLIRRLNHILTVCDAIGLGVFTAVGSSTAMSYYDNSFLVVSMGLLTGIGGGILRDVFSKEIPYVFKKEIYALASILGAVSFLLASSALSTTASLYISLFVTFAARMIAVALNLNIPVYRQVGRDGADRQLPMN
ncbi:trimeric intracellular cation channel family protein [Paenibacillus flagellatus]|uniref:Glycine transporter domain-containing protein n=1 Tax=Paenibacillus flagellatus TaxID=2211139 RepID=A0A2V5KNN0_9BACL|nr:trimeric intracellular cation channel family protein [Paenibacillus flagellatus]PYI56890.1 hypothetical protein DLM86_00095 [Paenibacillus flagellatus]